MSVSVSPCTIQQSKLNEVEVDLLGIISDYSDFEAKKLDSVDN